LESHDLQAFVSSDGSGNNAGLLQWVDTAGGIRMAGVVKEGHSTLVEAADSRRVETAPLADIAVGPCHIDCCSRIGDLILDDKSSGLWPV
jgi:hypothetical protein